MKLSQLSRRTLALIVVIIPLAMLFLYVVVRSGPLAPVRVTTGTVKERAITPALFGIGSVEAQYTFKIGPTVAGRVNWLNVSVGESVKAGQVLGEMDAIDLNDRIAAQQASIKSATAAQRQAEARQIFAQGQASRYEKLLTTHGTSEESVSAKRQELAIANADVAATKAEAGRRLAELQALSAQHRNLRLIAPVSGLVAARNVDPGTTVVAGQAVVEIIDPNSLWVNARFDQVSADGLKSGLPAQIALRSRHDHPLSGTVFRIEPRADAVTEEALAKVMFDTTPSPLPPLGELAEVTVQLAALPVTPAIPNAAIRTVNGQRGVWKLVSGKQTFTPVTIGRHDLDGNVQVMKGLKPGDQFIIYSEKTITGNSRIQIVERLVSTPQ